MSAKCQSGLTQHLVVTLLPRPPMCWLKRKVTLRLYIAPARTITPTGEYQRVVFAFVINTKLQLDICRGCRDWFPFNHLIS